MTGGIGSTTTGGVGVAFGDTPAVITPASAQTALRSSAVPTVTTAGSGGELAFTGSPQNLPLLFAGALAAIALGGGLLIARRRL
ncbi:hypothetical protein [Curtobacterium ammoniigenes]|uniref:hypothetical protein n=1 Tax=Curtobacterium ammoniigenes TaxID=395387 RepID=UPI0008312575|nr:hypothetical protein [Curtobacterium ammoniigenes]